MVGLTWAICESVGVVVVVDVGVGVGSSPPPIGVVGVAVGTGVEVEVGAGVPVGVLVGVEVGVGVAVPVGVEEGVVDGVVRLKANSLQLSASAHIVGARPQAVSPLNIFGSAFAHVNHAPSDGSGGPDIPLYCSALALQALVL